MTDEEHIELAGATMSLSLFEALYGGDLKISKEFICDLWKTFYDEMPKWIATQTGSWEYNPKTEEIEDNTAWKHKPNPAALELLNSAKLLGCKWAQDKGFPPPRKYR